VEEEALAKIVSGEAGNMDSDLVMWIKGLQLWMV